MDNGFTNQLPDNPELKQSLDGGSSRQVERKKKRDKAKLRRELMREGIRLGKQAKGRELTKTELDFIASEVENYL